LQIAAFSSDTREGLKEKLLAFKTAVTPPANADAREKAQLTAWHSTLSRKAFSQTDSMRFLLLIEEDVDLPARIEEGIFLLDSRRETFWSRSGFFFGQGGTPGKLGFLFPGQGSQYPGMGSEMAAMFPEAMEAMVQADKHFIQENTGRETPSLNGSVFPLPGYLTEKKAAEEQLRSTDIAQPAIGAVSLAMTAVLKRFGVHPHAVCGHSFGELSALHLAGRLDRADFLALGAARGRYMAEAPETVGEAGAMLAVRAPLETIETFIASENLDLVLANRNSHDQGVVSGSSREIDRAAQLCRQKKIRAIKLPVAAAFHTPFVEKAALPFEERLKPVRFKEGRCLLFSNTTGREYPEPEEEAKALLASQILNPVHFVENIETMFENSVTTLVEVGPKTVLTGLAASILKDQDVTALALDASSGRGPFVQDLASVLCTLASKGFSVDLTQWEEPGKEPVKKVMRIPITGANVKPKNSCDLPPSPPADTTTEAATAPCTSRPETRTGNDSPWSQTGKISSPHSKASSFPAANEDKTGDPKSTPLNQPDSIKGDPVKPTEQTPADPSMLFNAMNMVNRGLESMASLQAQTAKAHEKFLDTQAAAGRTLENMMAETRALADRMTTPNAAQNLSRNTAGPARRQQAADLFDHQSAAVHPPAPAAETDVHAGDTGRGNSAERGSPDIGGSSALSENHRDASHGEQQVVSAPAGGQGSRKPKNHDRPLTETPSAAAAAVSSEGRTFQEMIFQTVSDLTGFPMEMLEPHMEMESDLGIDSIKRVEIVAKLEQKLPDAGSLTPESMGELKTLGDIADLLETREGEAAQAPRPGRPESDAAEPPPATTAVPAPSKPAALPGAAMEILVKTVSDLTGFPMEMLEPDMEIESDLGIDSIKRVEIVAKLEQKLPDAAALTPEKMGSLKTLGDICFALDKISPAPAHPADSFPRRPHDAGGGAPVTPEKEKEKETEKEVVRQTIHLKKKSIEQVRFHNGARITIAADKCVYITRDGAGCAEAFQRAFETRGIKAKLIEITRKDLPPDDAAGLIIVSNALAPGEKQTGADGEAEFLKSAFFLAKAFAPALMASGAAQGALFATVSFLGGDFGFETPITSDPLQGGLAGLAKTADQEWDHVLCKGIDLPCFLSACLATCDTIVPLFMTRGSVEMGISNDLAVFPRLVPQPVTVESGSSKALGPEDIVLVTGGAKGVTARCALAMAERYACRLILVGRSEAPFSEPAWAQELASEAEIKKGLLANEFATARPTPGELQKAYQRIISNRDITANLQRITKAGAKAAYYSADIRNQAEINDLVGEVKKTFGTITAVVHGAGTLEDRLICDKSQEQFSRVFDTKVKGLANLIRATAGEPLKYLVLFSSVAARTGNKGQGDYAMANEVLNKIAQKKAVENPACRFISVNWGPWEGGMVTPSLQQAFLNRGIDLIPLKQGAERLIAEMEQNAGSAVEMVIGAHITPEKGVKPHIHGKQPQSRKDLFSPAFQQKVGGDSYPVLKDHCIDHEPVVPFALFVEWFAHAAEYTNPGLAFAGLDRMRLLKGIKPGKKSVETDIQTGRCKPCGTRFETDLRAVSFQHGQEQIHASAVGILKEKLPAPPVHSASHPTALAPFSLSVDQAYDRILFHGEKLRAIKSITGCCEQGIEVIASKASSPEEWIAAPFKKQWTGDPLLLDAAFQAAILWCHETTKEVCLPSYLANFRIYASFPQCRTDVRIILTVNEKSRYGLKGYFTFLDGNGVVIAGITGFEATIDPLLLERFKPSEKTAPAEAEEAAFPCNPNDQKPGEPLFTREQILAFAQGNPSEAFGKKYRIFDQERKIARLPRPPYFFMDRVVKTEPVQWKMEPGGWIEAEFDLPEEGWYFTADRSDFVPFSIVLEIALQPCGWLAAYAGSALNSDERLFFRNLGGEAELVKPVHRKMGTITMGACMTNVSKAGGLIIQDFAMEVRKKGEMLYKGSTNFGFFTQQALANQTGIKNSFLDYSPSKEECQAFQRVTFRNEAPLDPEDQNSDGDSGMPSKALRMIDTIDLFLPKGGFYQKGYIKAGKTVDPDEWFFKAHFYQDPVCPGSLGLESFLQTIRFFALQTLDAAPGSFQVQLAATPHKWSYRGQITPAGGKIEIQTHIKEVSTGRTPVITADGILSVNGLVIYHMEDFAVQLMPVCMRKPSAFSNQ
ncbi:MAG: SDR family oxidoreductase, partial [Desulfobacteraceae bacterium]